MEQVSAVILSVSGIFSAVIGLLLYIWKITQNANEKRHETNEVLISKLTDITVQQGNLLTKLDTMIEHHEKRLDHIK